MDLVPHFKILIEWAKQGLEASPNIPSNIYRYMKLKEALEEAFESITCVKITSLLNQLCKFSHKHLKFYPQILSKNEPWLHSNFGWA